MDFEITEFFFFFFFENTKRRVSDTKSRDQHSLVSASSNFELRIRRDVRLKWQTF